MMRSYLMGYVGTDSMPNCLKAVCWYLYQQPFLLTQQNLDYFKVDGLASNVRNRDLASGVTPYRMTMLYSSYFKRNPV